MISRFPKLFNLNFGGSFPFCLILCFCKKFGKLTNNIYACNNCPFKNGCFCHSEKNKVEFYLNFFRVATWEKAGFHKVNQKNKSGACPEKNLSRVVATLYYISSCPRKSQVAPSKSLFRVQIKWANLVICTRVSRFVQFLLWGNKISCIFY